MENTENPAPKKDNPESMVYSREEYAKKEFWDARFKETKGQFDWYANWKEIKPIFKKYVNYGEDLSAEKVDEKNFAQNILMVGSGNAKLSEEMAISDNFQKITNMDISQVVLDKMKERTDKFEKCRNFVYEQMDATNMTYEDNSFDLTIDKGTYDALACNEKDKTMIQRLFVEMLRVTKIGGAVLIITNGIPQKRLADFNNFAQLLPEANFKIEHEKIELSELSQMINIMRTKLGDKPLSHCMKDPAILKIALTEMQRIQKIKKEQELYSNPKTKMFGMLLKAKRLKEEQAEAEKQQQESKSTNEESKEEKKSEIAPNVIYNPKRQDFCMLYVIYKL